MLIAIYILTFFLVITCLFLGLLILMQLPKKEAGLGGTAFGGSTVDALIGAGAGNVLTKATKFSAIAFFVLIVSLSLLHSNYADREITGVTRQLQAQQATTPQATPVSNPLNDPAVTLPALQSPAGTAAPATNTPTEEKPATQPE